MHEAGLMSEALELAAAEAARAGATRIHRIRLRVGILSGVVPEALRFAFDALTPGSVAAQASLEIEPVTPVAWCERCEVEFASEDGAAACPSCGLVSDELRRGLELELASVEVS